MESVIRNRLGLMIDKVKSLSASAKDALQKFKVSELPPVELQVISMKLKTSIQSFVAETYNYFRLVDNPSADLISEYTTCQIEAEELVAELNVRLQKQNKDNSEELSKKGEQLGNVASKLPKIELCKFNGDLLSWHQFWDIFSSNVDSRKLSDVDKLLYLQSVLEGEARRTIEGLETTNKNYTIAVSTLKERYGKTSNIIDAHYAALYNVKAKDESIVESRRVYNEIERHLRVLSSLGEDVSHNHLRVVIMQKFSEDLVYELRIKMGTETDSIENIRKYLSQIISAREESNRIINIDGPSTSKERIENFTTEALHIRMGNNGERGRLFSRRPFKGQHENWKGKGNYNSDKQNFIHAVTKRTFKDNKKFGHDYHENRSRDGSLSFNLRKGQPSEFSGSAIGPQRKQQPNNDYFKDSITLRKRQLSNEHFGSKVQSSQGKKRKLSCIFCDKEHFSDECNIAQTIQERKRRLEGRCFNCLGRGHRISECKSNAKCWHCGEKGKHNRTLCPSKMSVKTEMLHTTVLKGNTILQTATIFVSTLDNCEKRIKCRLLLDCGSQRSYITNDLARRLNLPILERNNLSVFTFGASSPQEIESPLVNFKITSRTNNTKLIIANVVPHITNNIPGPHDLWSREDIMDNFNKECHKEHTLADDGTSNDKIDLLIGNDYYYSLILNEKIQIASDLYLVNSLLGWIFSGCFMPSEKDNHGKQLSVLTYFQSSLASNVFSEPDPPLRNDNLKILWNLESIGITDSPETSRDDEAVKYFNETTKFINKRYQVKWPWIDYPPSLPSNFGMSCGRLNSLIKRLDKDSLLEYEKVIKEQLRTGVIEVVSNPWTQVHHPIHYLPHHGVKQGDKLRIVYDASAKINDNKSLNECLYRGPLMLEELAGVLIRFREHSIGIVADVEKAFLQIGLQEEDRDVTRFIWIKNAGQKVSSDNLIHMRFCRVPFGIISSPFLLNATLRHHLKKTNSNVLVKIAEDLYVDNVVTGAKSVSEATALYKQSRFAFEGLSMNLRQWNTNSDTFKNTIPEKYQDIENKKVKVLGLEWDLTNDELKVKTKNETKTVITKREVLRTIASIFDPCGFVTPIIIPAKLFLQDLWVQKIQWDTSLPSESAKIWANIMKNLRRIERVSVPRFYLNHTQINSNDIDMNYELHCFTDASLQAYAAVVYLRAIQGKNTCISFVQGKSRVADKSGKSQLQIPKLELLGVVIGNRLLQYVAKYLRIKINAQYLWTDSKIVISWCETDKLLPPFNARRVDEIKRNNQLRIRYVPSQTNPADVATRPNCSEKDIELWLTGPKFLTRDPNHWPKNDHVITGGLLSQTVLAGQDPSETPNKTMPNKTSSHNTVPYIHNSLSDVSQTEIEDDISLICQLQQTYYPKEFEGQGTDLSRSLQLYIDSNHILRCGGRFANADWPEHQRHPILLPKNDPFTVKVIEKTHISNYHVGVSHTLSLVRTKFWIPHGRAQVQKVLKKCQACRKYGGGPYKLPPMAPLPAERVRYHPPFTFTGMDYFGPLMVKERENSEKRWICLFTCLAVRAIHLEVVGDMTAEECLLALRRFISARGLPKLIVSDNALQFKLTADVLTNGYCIEKDIKWKFIPELAPWFGGFYERLIGIVKNCMRKTLDKHLLNTTRLTTIIKEIEAVVNSRPLTVVGAELEHVVKPENFLKNSGLLLPKISDEEFLQTATITKSNLIEGWKRGQKILQEYIKMFVNQYLTGLRDRRSVHRQPRVVVNTVPKVGDIVQIKGNAGRALWTVGKIVDVFKGPDGHIRVARVSLSPNETLIRSIAHLYPLEVEEPEDIKDQQENSRCHNDTSIRAAELSKIDDGPSRTTTRLSAQRAKEKIREWTSQLLAYLPMY